MFARMLTLHVRLEKKPELAAKILKNVIPIVKHQAGPVDVLVLQDEVEFGQDRGDVAVENLKRMPNIIT